jgi:hypothetical protein
LERSFFYTSFLPVSPGDIVQPGNWGRNINAYTDPDKEKLKKLVIEQTFELVRVLHFPVKPSRFKSIFLFESFGLAREFTKTYKRPKDLIYEVRITDGSKPIHKGSMKAYDIPKRHLPFLPTLERIAFIYWEGRELKFPEIVVESSVEVITIHD